MKSKYTVMPLAAGALWAALLAGCGSQAGRVALPEQEPADAAVTTLAGNEPAADREKGEEARGPAASETVVLPSFPQQENPEAAPCRLPDAALLAERLRVNEERSARWDAVASLFPARGESPGRPEGWSRCVSLLREVVAGYRRLVAAGGPVPGGEVPLRKEPEPFAPFVQEILFLETRCDTDIFAAGAQRIAEGIAPEEGRPPFAVKTSPEKESPDAAVSASSAAAAVLPSAPDKVSSLSSPTEEQTARWNKALELLKLRRHDEAISHFSLLYDTPYAEQAAARLREASTQAAAELRRQAAAAFSKARKAVGRGERQTLLQQSKQLLETILERYPQATIRDKVIQNLREVDRQLAGSSDNSSDVPAEALPR